MYAGICVCPFTVRWLRARVRVVLVVPTAAAQRDLCVGFLFHWLQHTTVRRRGHVRKRVDGADRWRSFFCDQSGRGIAEARLSY